MPFPTRTGLVKIGRPNRNAPVLLTGNFGLTVQRVKRALGGQDAYLLVANSHGINVWCAAAGGHLTDHSVISVLKTSGIDELVDHRHVILPQLAATGIESRVIEAKTGWSVIWGPVRAQDIPPFLENGCRKTEPMRVVDFPWTRRLEMAAAWAFPISLVAALILLPWWKAGILPVVSLVWALALLMFSAFPLYRPLLRTTGHNVGFVFFDFGRRGLPLLLLALVVACVAAALLITGSFSWPVLLRWTVISLVVMLVLSLDLTGSTPIYKSGLHKDRLLQIILDTQRCTGVAACLDVCPTNVFDWDSQRRMASVVRGEACVQCGACLVQCPRDALTFQSPSGQVIAPATIRRFKLNMLGKRRGTSVSET